MLSQKTKLTNRKFYNKWIYKTSLRLPGCSILRTASLESIKSFCLEEVHSEVDVYLNSWRQASLNKDNLYKVTDFLSNYEKSEYCIRVERNSLDIYSNNKDFYEQVSNSCSDILIHRFEPNEKSIDLLAQEKHCIIVDKLPKDRYNYRVYLLPHKMSNDKVAKQKYLDWLKKQEPKVTCTPAIQKWFLETDWNWDRRYILVEDEATLLMLKLRNSEVIGRVYNFLISDK